MARLLRRRMKKLSDIDKEDWLFDFVRQFFACQDNGCEGCRADFEAIKTACRKGWVKKEEKKDG